MSAVTFFMTDLDIIRVMRLLDVDELLRPALFDDVDVVLLNDDDADDVDVGEGWRGESSSSASVLTRERFSPVLSIRSRPDLGVRAGEIRKRK